MKPSKPFGIFKPDLTIPEEPEETRLDEETKKELAAQRAAQRQRIHEVTTGVIRAVLFVMAGGIMLFGLGKACVATVTYTGDFINKVDYMVDHWPRMVDHLEAERHESFELRYRSAKNKDDIKYLLEQVKLLEEEVHDLRHGRR